jgi:ribosomal protein L14E/L6E/L27E
LASNPRSSIGDRKGLVMTGFSSEKHVKRLKNDKTHQHHEATFEHKKVAEIKLKKHEYEIQDLYEDLEEDEEVLETDEYLDAQLQEEWEEYKRKQNAG